MAMASRNAVYRGKRQFDVLFATTPRDPCYKQVRFIASYLRKRGFTVCLPEDHDVGKQTTTTLTENIKRSKCSVFPISRYKPSEEKKYIEDHAITTALKYKKGLLVPMLLDDQATIPDKFNQYNPLDACDYTSKAGLKIIADRLKRTIESTDQTGEAQNADIDEFLNQLGDDGKQYTMDELMQQGFRPSEQYTINISTHIVTEQSFSDDSTTRYNCERFNGPTEQRNALFSGGSSTDGYTSDGSYIRHRTRNRRSDNRTTEQRNISFSSSTDGYTSDGSYIRHRTHNRSDNRTTEQRNISFSSPTDGYTSDGSYIRHRTHNRSDNRPTEERNASFSSSSHREQRSRSFFEQIKELIWSLISPIVNYLFPSYLIAS